MRMRTIPALVVVLITICAMPPGLGAATLLVPGDYPTIQSAIKDAAPGDEVLVENGIYSGFENHNLDFLGKAITVRALGSEPGDCVIDCQGGSGEHRAFRFSGSEGPGSVVAGFTIRNGLATGGGAIRCETGAAPTITGCVFENNGTHGSANGGAIYADSGPTISDCRFEGNRTPGGGGGAIYCESGSPTITGNTFEGNEAVYGGALLLRSAVNAQISENRISASDAVRGGAIYLHVTIGCLINGNVIDNNLADWGAGIYLEGCQGAAIEGNIISGNKALVYGGAIHAREECQAELRRNTIVDNLVSSSLGAGGGLAAGWGSTVHVDNCIFWNNSAAIGPAIAALEEPANSLSIDCSDVDGGQEACAIGPGSSLEWGTGMFDADPMFCNPVEGDYGLDQHSPCTAEAQPACGRVGSRDAGCAGQVFSVSLACVPDSGTLVFQTMMSMDVTNLCVSQFRRIAGRLDVERADGSMLTYWRHGWLNLPAGTNYARSWPLLLPPRPSMVGANTFFLVGEDVTPPPYNLPPYWPAGETQVDTCTVTATLP